MDQITNHTNHCMLQVITVFYSDVHGILTCSKVVEGQHECILKLVSDISMQDQIMKKEMTLYRDVDSCFRTPLAIRHRSQMAPGKYYHIFH